MVLRHEQFLINLENEHPRLWINPADFQNNRYLFETKYKGIKGYIVFQVTDEPLIAFFCFEQSNPHAALEYKASSYKELEEIVTTRMLKDVEQAMRLHHLYSPPQDQFKRFFQHYSPSTAKLIREHLLQKFTNDEIEDRLAVENRRTSPVPCYHQLDVYYADIPCMNYIYVHDGIHFHVFSSNEYAQAQTLFMTYALSAHQKKMEEYFNS